MTRNSALRRLALVALAFLPAAAQALPEDRNQPIKIAADSAELNEKQGVAVYIGQVQVRQGSMQIEADKVTLYSDQGGISRVIAIGQPAHYNHRQTHDSPITHAYGDRIEYEVAQEQIVLTRNAVLVQGGDTFSGNVIHYDQAAGIVNARSGKSNGKQRVQMVIQPKSQGTPPSAEEQP